MTGGAVHQAELAPERAAAPAAASPSLRLLSEVIADEVRRLEVAGRAAVPSKQPLRLAPVERLVAAGRVLAPGFEVVGPDGRRHPVRSVLTRTVVVEVGERRELLRFDRALVDPAGLRWREVGLDPLATGRARRNWQRASRTEAALAAGFGGRV